MRSRHDRLLGPVLGALQQLLAEVVVHRRVGAAAGGAGQRHGLGAGAVAAHQQLGAGAHERALRAADAVAVAVGERRAQAVEHRARGRCRARRCTRTSRASTTFSSVARADPLDRAADGLLVVRGRRRARHPRAGDRVGVDQRHLPRARAPRAASRPARAAPSGDSSPSTATDTVMRASSPRRANETSGSTSWAASKPAHSGARPPAWAKAKPPRCTGPDPGGASGSAAGSSASVRESSSRACGRHRARSGRRRRACSSRGRAEAADRVAVAPRLLDAEEAVVRPARGEHGRGEVQRGIDRLGDRRHRPRAAAARERQRVADPPLERRPPAARSSANGLSAWSGARAHALEDDGCGAVEDHVSSAMSPYLATAPRAGAPPAARARDRQPGVPRGGPRCRARTGARGRAGGTRARGPRASVTGGILVGLARGRGRAAPAPAASRPGRSTRASSAIAARSSSTCSSTWLQRIASKAPSSNGSAVMSALHVHARRVEVGGHVVASASSASIGPRSAYSGAKCSSFSGSRPRPSALAQVEPQRPVALVRPAAGADRVRPVPVRRERRPGAPAARALHGVAAEAARA